MAQAGKAHLFAQSKAQHRIGVSISLGQRALTEQTRMLAQDGEQKRGRFIGHQRSLRGNEQGRLPQQPFQKTGKRGPRSVVGAVMAEMTFLT